MGNGNVMGGEDSDCRKKTELRQDTSPQEKKKKRVAPGDQIIIRNCMLKKHIPDPEQGHWRPKGREE
jgi:hypothetical protein